jgi:large subunit ribosomal protein L13
MFKTFSPKKADITHQWYLVDASSVTLGRLSSQIATILMGKNKPNFSPHVDGGDNVVVINAANLKVTGSKLTDKEYHRHSGYPGGLTTLTLEEMMVKNPSAVIEKAVAGMLPKNRLTDDRMRRLKVYPTAEHAHQGQSPKKVEFTS